MESNAMLKELTDMRQSNSSITEGLVLLIE
jgi:hypothetical protein